MLQHLLTFIEFIVISLFKLLLLYIYFFARLLLNYGRER